MTLAAFAAKWTHPDYPPEQMAESDLREAEAALGIHFPQDYVAEVLRTGLPNPTIALLNATVERDIDMAVVSDFFAPGDIVSQTRDWRDAGMPDYLVAFANDCSGNMFCFRMTEPGIWFFDHDFGTVDRVAPSFSEWVDAQVAIEPVED